MCSNNASTSRQPLERASTFHGITSGITGSTRKAATSISQATRDAINADVPLGAWAAAAEASSKAPTLGEIRKGSFAEAGWTNNSFEPLRELPRRNTNPGQKLEVQREQSLDETGSHPTTTPGEDSRTLIAHSNGERSISDQAVSPKVPWTRSTVIGLKAFWRWFLTPFGFLVTIYALNVVAWGGMLFLLLCNAAPAMCWALDDQEGWMRDCNHLQSARRIWLEVDSQILNALFCVTGFGLIPWRFRDLYYLLRWRLLPGRKYGRQQKMYGLRTLGGLYKGWVRLPGSDTLDTMTLAEYDAVAHPSTNSELTKYELHLPSVRAGALDPRIPWKTYKTPAPPLTGVRAPPTALWKIDFFVWCNVANTFLQGCLCGVMWGFSRFDRPSWSTGLFIALACVVSGVAGIMSFLEGKKIKRIEGVQPSLAVLEELDRVQSEEATNDLRLGEVKLPSSNTV